MAGHMNSAFKYYHMHMHMHVQVFLRVGLEIHRPSSGCQAAEEIVGATNEWT